MKKMDNNYNMIPEEFNEDNFRVEKLQVNKDKTMEKSKWSFLTSPVFWQLFCIGLVTGLFIIFPGNVYVQGFSAMIGVWFGGSVGVNVLNKPGEKRVEVAKIEAGTTKTTVSMPSNSSFTATTSPTTVGEN